MRDLKDRDMKILTRLLIAVLAFVLAIVYSVPSLTLMLTVGIAYFSEYVSLIFCFVFAWNSAKIVEYFYKKFCKRT